MMILYWIFTAALILSVITMVTASSAYDKKRILTNEDVDDLVKLDKVITISKIATILSICGMLTMFSIIN